MPNNIPQWLDKLTLLGIACALSSCGLPDDSGKIPSTALKDNGRTTLAKAVRPHTAVHPGESGLRALADGRDALTARLALADAAQRSLDVQYYIWKKDMSGKILAETLLRAADRGVRVRLLLDDLGTMPSDKVLLGIDSHPNIEVRMFNPVRIRTPRLLGMATDFARINKRMHNKSFIADGEVAIVGGRNIGNEYFGAHEAANFADLDVAAIGPVVNEVSAAFDLYWNHRASIPITTISRHGATPGTLAMQRAALTAYGAETDPSIYNESVRNSEFARQIRSRTVSYYWGHATIVSDHPDKVLTSPDRNDTHLSTKLRETVHGTNHELFLVSPYFVPGKQGVALLSDVHKRGVRVVVITNSLASTDGIPVHAGYQRYRKPLLEAGIELYEMKPTAHGQRKREPDGLRGSSGASLHAKTFTFDRRKGFIGSYNLDPRSSKLKTEMGVLFDCPALAKRLPETIERTIDRDAYRLELDGSHLVWISREEGARETRLDSEPGASFWKRTKVRVLSWLPIEGLL